MKRVKRETITLYKEMHLSRDKYIYAKCCFTRFTKPSKMRKIYSIMMMLAMMVAAVLNSGVWQDGEYLPFSEAINSLPDWLDDYD